MSFSPLPVTRPGVSLGFHSNFGMPPEIDRQQVVAGLASAYRRIVELSPDGMGDPAAVQVDVLINLMGAE